MPLAAYHSEVSYIRQRLDFPLDKDCCEGNIWKLTSSALASTTTTCSGAAANHYIWQEALQNKTDTMMVRSLVLLEQARTNRVQKLQKAQRHNFFETCRRIHTSILIIRESESSSIIVPPPTSDDIK